MTLKRNFLQILMLAAAIAGNITVEAAAAEYARFRAPSGTVLDYAFVLPTNFDPSRTYPAILALPPGPQTMAMVNAGLSSYWEAEGARRGFIVVSPAAPDGRLFYRGGEAEIPSFLTHVRATLPIAGPFHVAGISNGGLSAFRVALANPDLFQSITVLPGFPPSEAEFGQLGRLHGLTINMFVGERDTGWRDNMEVAAREFERLGLDTHFEVLPNEGHVLQTIAGARATRLFDRIENQEKP